MSDTTPMPASVAEAAEALLEAAEAPALRHRTSTPNSPRVKKAIEKLMTAADNYRFEIELALMRAKKSARKAGMATAVETLIDRAVGILSAPADEESERS